MFSREKGQAPKTLPQSGESKLKKRFRFAVYGDYCRTRSYVHPVTEELKQKEWLEASSFSQQDGWTIYKMKWSPASDAKANPAGVVLRSIYPNSQNISFFEAIEKLALYEGTQPELGYRAWSENEINVMSDHYKPFAEREGIVFDVDNTPHPTDKGRVRAEGSFPADVFDKAKSAYDHKASSLPSLPTGLLPKIVARPLAESAIDIQALLKPIEKVSDYLGSARVSGWHTRYYVNDLYEPNRAKYLEKFLNKTRQEYEAKLSGKSFDFVDDEDALKKQFQTAFDLVELYAYLGCARGIFEGIRDYSGYSFYSRDRYNFAIERAYSKLAAMGYDEEYRSFADAWVTDSARTGAEEAITQIKEWMKEYQRALKNAVHKKISAPPPLLGLPSPQGGGNV